MKIVTILAAIQAGVAMIPEGLDLIAEVKGLLSLPDQAAIDAALANANAQADAQHNEAQSL